MAVQREIDKFALGGKLHNMNKDQCNVQPYVPDLNLWSSLEGVMCLNLTLAIQRKID